MAYRTGMRTHTNNVNNKLAAACTGASVSASERHVGAVMYHHRDMCTGGQAPTAEVGVVIGVEVGVIDAIKIEPVLIVHKTELDSSLTRSLSLCM